MSLLEHPAQDILRESGQQAVVIQAEAADQGTGAGQLDHLGRRQLEYRLGDILTGSAP